MIAVKKELKKQMRSDISAKDRCNIGKLINKLDKKIEKSIISFNTSFLLKKAESHGTFDKQSF